MSADLRFIVIGAQKGGTTSLFEYLRRHPEVHLPAHKEIGFFVDRNYHRGWDWYVRQVLRNVPAGSIAGEASVAYMSGSPMADSSYATEPTTSIGDVPQSAETLPDVPPEEVVPRRIASHLPNIRLLCVLRDPVDRAFSQYRMEVLEGAESRSFVEVLDELLTPDSLTATRAAPTRTNSYISYGEYARILKGFLTVFPPSQLLIVFSDDLAGNAEPTLKKIFGFIGVADDFVPDNLDVRYREGTVRQRVPALNLYAWQARIARMSPVRALWRALPHAVRERIDRIYRVASFRVVMWNAHRGDDAEQMTSTSSSRLRAHFRQDGEELRELLGVDVPWLNAWSRD